MKVLLLLLTYMKTNSTYCYASILLTCCQIILLPLTSCLCFPQTSGKIYSTNDSLQFIEPGHLHTVAILFNLLLHRICAVYIREVAFQWATKGPYHRTYLYSSQWWEVIIFWSLLNFAYICNVIIYNDYIFYWESRRVWSVVKHVTVKSQEILTS